MSKSSAPAIHGKRARRPAGNSPRGLVSDPADMQVGKTLPRNKTRLTMYLDTAVVEYFRSRSGGRGYQTMINEALKQAIERENLEDVLRRVIREEARPYKSGKG
jgi:uncharacterized protein (DUF4415 family)